MLKEFTIKNFKSINEEVTFSMEADIDRVSEHPNHIISIRNNHLLRVCSMYGPNGGGKSNILKALSFLRRIVVFGSAHEGIDDYSCVFSDDNISEFSAFFSTVNFDIGYNVQFSTQREERINDEEKIRLMPRTKINIINESVYVLSNKKYIEICSRGPEGILRINDKTIFKGLSKKPIGNSVSIVRFMYEYLYNDLGSYSQDLRAVFELYQEIAGITPLSNNSFDRVYPPILKNIIAQNKDELIRLLDAADIHLDDIVVEENGISNKVYFVRKIVQNEKEILKKIELGEESSGTQKLFGFLIKFLRYKGSGCIFLGDDMNAYLHPKLLAAVIEMFNSYSNVDSQLIFNSHDIVNMNNSIFRRDEIWFVYRDQHFQTTIVPLSNITNYKGKQIRNDAIYSKQYLEGKYGADPFILKGLGWNE